MVANFFMVYSFLRVSSATSTDWVALRYAREGFTRCIDTAQNCRKKVASASSCKNFPNRMTAP